MSTTRYSDAELELRLERLQAHITDQIPRFEVRGKRDSTLMRVVDRLLFFNPHFMDRYVTTFYPRIYVPDGPWQQRSIESRISVLAHEYVHLRDRQRLGWSFNLLYLAPQIFSLCAIGAIWNPWWLLSILFLLPWPSPGRTWLELRGYTMSIAMHWSLRGERANLSWIETQFTGSNYYWMWPFRRTLKRWMTQAAEAVEKGRSPLREIAEVMEAIES